MGLKQNQFSNLLVMRGSEGSALLHFELYLDEIDQESLNKVDKLKNKLRQFRELQMEEKMVKAKISTRDWRDLVFREYDLSGVDKKSSWEVAKIVSVMVIYMLITTILPPLILSFVREREHNTIYSLYLTAISEGDISVGKFVAVVVQAMASFFAYGISSFTVVVYFSKIESGSSSIFAIPMAKVFLLIFCIFSLVVLITAALVFLVSFASSAHQAQIIASYSIMFLLPIGLLAISTNISLQGIVLVVPYVNAILLTKYLFVQEIAWYHLFFVVMSNWLPAGIILGLTRGSILKEFKAKKSEDIFANAMNVMSQNGQGPTAGVAILFFLVLFIFSFFSKFYFYNVNSFWVTIIGMAIIIYLMSRKYNLNIDDLFSIGWKDLRNFLAVAALFYFYATWAHALEKKMGFPSIGQQMGWITILATICHVVVYEIAFRGIILAGLSKQYGERISLALSSFFFAILGFSFIQFIPILFLGFLLGYVYQKSKSLIAPMVGHFVFKVAILFAV
ncbi:MAG: hypothetical protein A2451_13735 [Bdellovibrionales bacterium RIFOXYC2_FULL_39_8]|nr:MAG: hypothetical protein A2451_13735 [Bdellovibrionales bacterium RIFOXYC2_FULL_39_8]